MRRVEGNKGFALGGVVLLLFAVLICVLAWRAWVFTSAVSGSPGAGSAYGKGVLLGTWGAVIIAPLIVLAIAWGVGKLVSLMFGRSDEAGNVGALGVMLLALGLFGYGAYATTIAAQQAKARAGQAGGGGAASGAQAKDPLAQQRDDLRRLQERNEQMAQANRDRTRSLTQPGAGSPPPTPITPSPAPPSQPAPNPARPGTATPAPAPVAREEDAAARRVGDEAIKAMDDRIAAVEKTLAAVRSQIGSPPKRDIRDLRARAETISAAMEELAALATGLRGMNEDVRSRLEATGVASASGEAVRIVSGYKHFQRATGAESLGRTLEHAKREAELLRDAIGRWTYGKDGKVESKDFQLQSSANSARFFLNADLGRWDSMVGELKGK
jgi:hypothetical protein